MSVASSLRPKHVPLEVIDLYAQQVGWLFDGYDLTLMHGHAIVPLRALPPSDGAAEPEDHRIARYRPGKGACYSP